MWTSWKQEECDMSRSKVKPAMFTFSFRERTHTAYVRMTESPGETHFVCSLCVNLLLILWYFSRNFFLVFKKKNVENAAVAFFVQSCVATKFPWRLYTVPSSIGVDTKKATAAVSTFLNLHSGKAVTTKWARISVNIFIVFWRIFFRFFGVIVLGIF